MGTSKLHSVMDVEAGEREKLRIKKKEERVKQGIARIKKAAAAKREERKEKALEEEAKREAKLAAAQAYLDSSSEADEKKRDKVLERELRRVVKRKLKSVDASVTDQKLRVLAAAYVRNNGAPGTTGRDMRIPGAKVSAILDTERGRAAVVKALEEQEAVIVFDAADVANEAWRTARKKDVSYKDKLDYLRFCAEMVGAVGKTAEFLAEKGARVMQVNVMNFADKRQGMAKPVIEAEVPRIKHEEAIDVEALG